MLRRSARIKERQRATNKTATLLSGSSVARQFNAETQFGNATKPHLATKPFNTKKRRTNELKGDHLQEKDDQQGFMSGQENSGGSTNRAQLSQKKSTLRSPSNKKARRTDTDTRLVSSTILANPTDPCRVLPTEVWHQILSYLPPGIARISVVSKAWLDGCRSHPIWRAACDKGGLGDPDNDDKGVYNSRMALVCASSYWVCEACLSSSKGQTRLSHIPLPASLPGYNNSNNNDSIDVDIDNNNKDYDSWKLCHVCRSKYHEPIRLLSNPYELLQLSGTVWLQRCIALEGYYLTEDDLPALGDRVFIGEADVECYLHSHVRAHAFEAHGGLVGIEAIRQGLALKREEQFEKRRARDRAFLLNQEI
ncbi:hypothetical protein BGX33_007557 [Mortierella sp. NVP41]|nr:hypothetical protein BGX33_007557 [Mortierella sp. NVP41]